MSASLFSGSLRAAMRAQPVASSSRTRIIRSAHSDRYATIHAFFVRQSQIPTTPQSSVRQHLLQRRFNSSKRCDNCSDTRPPATPKGEPSASPPKSISRQDHAQDYTPFIQRLIASSKSIQSGSPHRPTKEELLGAASGWWQRFRIRLKWFTIRGWRRWNTDDFSAFASLFVLGNSESFTQLNCLRE